MGILRRKRGNEANPSSVGSEPRNTFLGAKDSVFGHFGAGNFLDLTGGARSIVDKNALPEPQIDDVMLARHLFRSRRCRREPERASQQQRKRSDL
jgi:hypothetical protein